MKKVVDFFLQSVIISLLRNGRDARNDAEWCNGSTADSDSVSRGSNPFSVVYNEVWLSLVERYVRDVEVAGSNPVTSIFILK